MFTKDQYRFWKTSNILFFILFWCPPSTPFAQTSASVNSRPDQTKIIMIDGTFLQGDRTNPATRINLLKEGDTLLFLSEEDDWYRGQFGNTVGWVSRRFAKLVKDSSHMEKALPAIKAPGSKELSASLIAPIIMEYIDVVFLKNGSIIKGLIIENVPNSSIKLETKDGSIFVLRYTDILKVIISGATNLIDEGASSENKQAKDNLPYVEKPSPVNPASHSYKPHVAYPILSVVPHVGIIFSYGEGNGFDTIKTYTEGKSEIYWGLKGGIGLNIRPAPNFAIEPRILYEQKGIAVDIGTDKDDLVLRMSFLSIPIAIQLYAVNNGPVSPFISVAPIPAVCLSSDLYKGYIKEDIADYTNTFFFGIQFGGGLAIKAGHGNLVMEGGYTIDFTQILKTGEDFPSDVFVNSLSFDIGYQF